VEKDGVFATYAARPRVHVLFALRYEQQGLQQTENPKQDNQRIDEILSMCTSLKFRKAHYLIACGEQQFISKYSNVRCSTSKKL